MKLYQKKVQPALVSCQGRERCPASRMGEAGGGRGGDVGGDRRGRGMWGGGGVNGVMAIYI